MQENEAKAPLSCKIDYLIRGDPLDPSATWRFFTADEV
jgi:hypothetical protein